nr:retrotransposon protein, putative, Ty1-copia subclass [Tanacetum cinerariifolium]
MTTSVRNNLVFRSFFEKQKLTRPNFIDWYRQLRLVLSTEDKENYLEHPIPAAPIVPLGQQVPPQALAAHSAWVKGQKEEEGQSVSSHVLKMKGYIDNLERIGQPVGKNLAGLRGSKKLKPNALSLYAIPRDGIYEIDMSCSNTNDSSMYAITNKRAKINLDSSLLWHCHLGHISKKRIKKLQHDGLLNSIDIDSLGKCVSCMSNKMKRKPYSHQVERAKDLLGLIHTDVCGPFKIVSRQRASYFFTFTDDFSCYGYVYLLKHKHEVFETFKVFQKEVENQLGKTIKSLRSDRG